jgi:archaemetzincin
MSVLSLLPIGTPDPGIVQELGLKLQEYLGWEFRLLPPLPRPISAYNAVRNQYEALHILRAIADQFPAAKGKLLAVADDDIAIPMLTFVFGQAQLNGRIALMSLARLRQDFYGLTENPELLMVRAWKEALHELGHTLGLIHCPTPACIMALANNIQHVDEKGTDFCGGCKALFTDARRAVEVNAPKETL